MKEISGGCCVCLDERGWSENKLVYCDGHGCNVAVHQACYGITKIPQGSWFCRKCESQERVARVRCELCPSREGALKRTDTGGWAHVVCALYVPEVAFGDVSTMEPILVSKVPRDKYGKVCYLCVQQNRQSEAGCGACIKCARPSCRTVFHVSCGQSAGLLREELSGPGSSTYRGYCSTHADTRKTLSLPLYSSTSSDSILVADGHVAPQEESLAENQLTTDAMSQDEDNSQLGAVVDGDSNDSIALGSPNVTGLTDTHTQVKVSLAAKVKRNSAAKVKAKSVRHQRVLKRGQAGKFVPSSKRRKTRETDVDSTSGTVDDSIGPPAGDTEVEKSPVDGTDRCQDLMTNSVVNTPRGELLPSTLEEFLERQWQRGCQFLMDELQQCDASTLLETLKRLQTENKELSRNIDQLAQRKEHLLALRRGLSAPVVSTTQTVDTSPKSNDFQLGGTGKNPTENAFIPDHSSTESRERETPIEAKNASKSRSSTPSKSSEKRKRSPKKTAKSDQLNTETQRATPKKSRTTAKNSKKASISDPVVCMPPASTYSVESEGKSFIMPGSGAVDTATMAATSAVQTERSFSERSLALTSVPDLPGEKQELSSASQTEAAPKKKRRSTSDKTKKSSSRVRKDANHTASPTLQLSKGHTVSSLLDHSISHSPFYQPSTFARPSLLPPSATEASFLPVATMQSRLFYNSLVHDSVRMAVSQHAPFSTEFGPSPGPDPSGVLAMTSGGIGIHSLSSGLPTYFSNRPT